MTSKVEIKAPTSALEKIVDNLMCRQGSDVLNDEAWFKVEEDGMKTAMANTEGTAMVCAKFSSKHFTKLKGEGEIGMNLDKLSKTLKSGLLASDEEVMIKYDGDWITITGKKYRRKLVPIQPTDMPKLADNLEVKKGKHVLNGTHLTTVFKTDGIELSKIVKVCEDNEADVYRISVNEKKVEVFTGEADERKDSGKLIINVDGDIECENKITNELSAQFNHILKTITGDVVIATDVKENEDGEMTDTMPLWVRKEDENYCYDWIITPRNISEEAEKAEEEKKEKAAKKEAKKKKEEKKKEEDD